MSLPLVHREAKEIVHHLCAISFVVGGLSGVVLLFSIYVHHQLVPHTDERRFAKVGHSRSLLGRVLYSSGRRSPWVP